jgi:hypothetical protein
MKGMDDLHTMGTTKVVRILHIIHYNVKIAMESSKVLNQFSLYLLNTTQEHPLSRASTKIDCFQRIKKTICHYQYQSAAKKYLIKWPILAKNRLKLFDN